MKKIITILAVAALVATSCTETNETDSNTGVDTNVTVDTDTAAVVEETPEVTVVDTVAADSSDSSVSQYAEGTVDRAIEDFLASDETGTKKFTLDALGNAEDGEGSEMSEEAKLQLSHIADILAANPDLKAEIQAHGKKVPGVKIATTGRATWVKTKLVLFKDFKGEQLTTVGKGAEELLEGVDPKDDAQKRIVIALTK